MSASQTYHVLVCDGDCLGEVDEALKSIGSPGEAGLHRHFFVTRANQTVVMTTDADAPLARALRDRPGWREPTDGGL